MRGFTPAERDWMRMALRLARRAWGRTSPNPMVGAVVVRRGRVLGRGWHRAAGQPHAEVEALADARARGFDPARGTLLVTLEPCCTQGRTPPCTEAIIRAGIRKVVVAATDPNPVHRGRGFEVLRRAGVEVRTGLLEGAAMRLNEAFNHWVVEGTPWVTVKAAMTLDGKIATAAGESKWITSEPARQEGMRLRVAADAILVGVNTVLADDPALTIRGGGEAEGKRLRRVVLDGRGRTPPGAKVWGSEGEEGTTVVVTRRASARRVAAMRQRGRVWVAPEREGRVDVGWVLRRLGREGVTHLLVEGGGEVNASFLLGGWAKRVVFFYAPMILGGREARKAVGGEGVLDGAGAFGLRNLRWRRVGPDLMLTAEVAPPLGAGRSG